MTLVLGTTIPYRLVAVEWDSHGSNSDGWQSLDDPTVSAVLCLSVGFLVGETATAIALAPNLGDVQREDLQALGIISIPKGAIRRVEDVALAIGEGLSR
jgi:hypothetical protein